jgi:hypothetical protein
MGNIVLAVMVVGLAWLAVRVGVRTSDQTIAVVVRGFRGWRSDSWPRGVQEEDRDRPWGWPDHSAPKSQQRLHDRPPPAPKLVAVRPSTHLR